MKALSLWQPWANAMATGEKRIETRAWPFPESMAGDYIAIHAAKRWTRAEVQCEKLFRSFGIDLGYDRYKTPPLGAVVALVRLVECLPTRGTKLNELLESDNVGNHEYTLGNYWPVRFGWVTTDLIRL